MIGIVDYDIGNLRSVQKALQHVGGPAVFVRTPEEIARVDALVLPGVGAFGDCVRSLAKSGMWDATLAWAKSERPFFGICVGFQMLFESSEEAPGEKGLGLFAGTVRKFSDKHHLKIPQIGWNVLEFPRAHALFRALAPQPYVYFVHSYYAQPADEADVLAWSDYGARFCAAAGHGKIAGVQFHPEKSQTVGLQILKNFGE